MGKKKKPTASAQKRGRTGHKPPPEGQRFKPGQSGNPGGRPKRTDQEREALEEIRRLTARAVAVLGELLNGPDRRLRLAAAQQILDRSLGKPVERHQVTGKGDEPLVFYLPKPEDGAG